MTEPIDEIASYNRGAWDHQVQDGNRWTKPVDAETIKRARDGEWGIVLTPTRPVPREWFPPLRDANVLCLASGGGQQAPLLAAAGARVTLVDNSPAQLAQDEHVAKRENLEIQTVLGDMRDLASLGNPSFDLIVHPCSNCFVPDLQPVWNECARVLRRGGVLIAGFLIPFAFVFDEDQSNEGRLVVRHKLPYTDQSHLTEEELQRLKDKGEPLMFSHSLSEQIGGQLQAGLQLVDLYEDIDPSEPLSQFFPPYLATRSVKPM